MGCHLSKLEEGQTATQQARPFQAELEARRLKALQDCRILDKPSEQRFDSITKLLSGLFNVPIALVSLIDSDRLVFHSVAGPGGCGSRRLHSFCDASLKAKAPTMMVVEDTLQDARFQHSQFVEGPPHVRFYAGAPLISSEGYVMGSLGILDLVPRSFPAEQLNMICNFAELVVRELERDKVLVLQQQQMERLVRATTCFTEAIALCDVTHPDTWRLLYTNGSWDQLTGIPNETSLQSSFWDLMDLPPGKNRGSGKQLAAARGAIAEREPFTLTLVARDPAAAAGAAGSQEDSGGAVVLEINFHPASNDHLGDPRRIPLIGIPNFVEMRDGEEAEEGSVHYFAIAQPLQKLDPPSSPRSPLHGLSAGGYSTGGASSSGRRSFEIGSFGSAGSSCHSSCFGLNRPGTVKHLKLGPMLGSGSFGKVYRALWHGSHVACKILETLAEAAPATASGGSNATTLGESSSTLTSASGSSAAVADTASGASGAGAVDPQQQAPLFDPSSADTVESAAANRAHLLEALLSKELLHPQIVQTFEYASTVDQQDDGMGDGAEGPRMEIHRIWIIQEYCNHGTLIDAIERGWLQTKRDVDGPPNLPAILLTAQEIASAMSYLHSRGILHGDLSGLNVLLTNCTKDARRFTAKVCDFGPSRMLVGNAAAESGPSGTITHMPPEALDERKIFTKSVDVYSFGVLLYEMYSHTRAWAGCCPSQIVYLVATVGKHDALQLPQGTPPAFKSLVEACLHPDHEQRPIFPTILETITEIIQEARPPPPPGSSAACK